MPWLRAGFTKVELGGAVGRASCAMAAVTEIGLACALCAKLAQQEPERYGETARALEEKAQKALQRQKEQRRHEKNLLKAKKKPWAAPAAKPKARPRAGGPGAAGREAARPPRHCKHPEKTDAMNQKGNGVQHRNRRACSNKKARKNSGFSYWRKPPSGGGFFAE